MTRIRSHAVLAVALVASAACARSIAVSEAYGCVARVDEMPSTTASTPARTHFTVGPQLLDVGRPREARDHFRIAVAQDPTFAYGYLPLAFASPSTQEFKENLDR